MDAGVACAITSLCWRLIADAGTVPHTAKLTDMRAERRGTSFMFASSFVDLTNVYPASVDFEPGAPLLHG